MKKNITVALSILAVIIVFGVCFIHSNSKVTFTKDVSTNTSYEGSTVENEAETSFYLTAVKGSHTAIIAEFEEYKEEGMAVRCVFRNKEVLYGYAPDEEINVLSELARGVLTSATFTEGEEYLLILRREETIFMSFAVYTLMGEAVIPMDDINSSTWKKGTIEVSGFANGSDVADAIKEMAENNGHFTSVPTKMFLTEDLETVANNCDAVLRVCVEDIIAQGEIVPQYSYRCIVKECLRGEYTENADGYIFINAYPESMTSQNEYIVMLSATYGDIGSEDEGEDSVFMVQASTNGIIDVNNPQADLVYDYINN